jgi:hypothetical protein
LNKTDKTPTVGESKQVVNPFKIIAVDEHGIEGQCKFGMSIAQPFLVFNLERPVVFKEEITCQRLNVQISYYSPDRSAMLQR